MTRFAVSFYSDRRLALARGRELSHELKLAVDRQQMIRLPACVAQACLTYWPIAKVL